MGKKLKTELKEKKARPKLFGVLPTEISGAIITVSANREVSVDGCRGVIDYNENLIKLRVVGGTITVYGTTLNLAELSDRAAVITGTVSNIEFSERLK